MFSNFKNVINSSLQELERLGENSVNQGQQQQQQQQAGSSGATRGGRGGGKQDVLQTQRPQLPLLQTNGRGFSESTIGTSSTTGRPGVAAGPDDQRRPASASGLSIARDALNASGASVTAPSMPPSRPRSSGGAGPGPGLAGNTLSRSPQAQANRDLLDNSFPSFGLGGLKRSLSGLPRTSLDLSNLRTSLDIGPRSNNASSSSLNSPITPSRDGRELGEWPASASAATGPGSPKPGAVAIPRSKRRYSARSASMSAPFTPNTMSKLDPFFFASLQGLPDELKIAAFTPLPEVNDDEFLDELDQELNANSSTIQIQTVPITRAGPSNLARSIPSGFKPGSAPALTSPMYASPPRVASPFTTFEEQPRSSLAKDILHEEAEHEDETSDHASAEPIQVIEAEESSNASVASSAPSASEPMPEPTTPLPVFDDLPDLSKADGEPVQEPPQPIPLPQSTRESSPSRFGSRSATPTPTVQVESDPSRPSSAKLATSSEQGASGSRTPSGSQGKTPPPLLAPTPSRPTIATARVHEPLAARLARISRNSSPAGRAPSREATPPPATTEDISERPLPEDLPAAYEKLFEERETIERILRKHTDLKTLSDVTSFERLLKGQSASASVLKASQDLDDLRKQLASEQSRTVALEKELQESKAEVTKAQTKAKEEEEKKAKSIQLLKAVRQKLIKAEKDREEAEILRDAAKQSDDNAVNELRNARARFESEVMALRTGQEQQLNKLKTSFEREANSIRASYEREAAARKGQHDLEVSNLRSAHAKAISAREGRISTLEASLRDLRREKDSIFEQMQSKQAEVESAVREQERLQAQQDEMQYELKEARDKTLALQEEVQSFKKARLDQTRDEGHTRKLLADLEASNADKARTYEDRIKGLERERSEAEERMASKLQEKLREVDRMRREIEKRDAENNEELQRREERQQRMDRSETLNRTLQDKVNALEMLLNESKLEIERIKEEESTIRELLADQTRRTSDLEGRNEELQSKEAQLRSSNKTLREELRKVQSGVLLSERSRNPGVGYFSNLANASSASLGDSLKSPPAFSPALPGGTLTPAGQPHGSGGAQSVPLSSPSASLQGVSTAGSDSGGALNPNEQALNFEYIRNVILQFLEHKEMRPHLVSVLGVILQFTPAETRRLASKASA